MSENGGGIANATTAEVTIMEGTRMVKDLSQMILPNASKTSVDAGRVAALEMQN